MKMKKSLAAAIATAVTAYITTMEAQGAMAGQSALQAPPPPPPVSMWSIAGRQAGMEMRRMWQMRIPR